MYKENMWHEKYLLGHFGDLLGEDRLMGLACSRAWKPVKTRRRGRTHCLGEHSCWKPFCLPLDAAKQSFDIKFSACAVCRDQTKLWFQPILAHFFFHWRNFAVLVLRRTCAHASEWGLSGERLKCFSLILLQFSLISLSFCFLFCAFCFWHGFATILLAKLCTWGLSGESLKCFSLNLLSFCFLLVHSASDKFS